MTDDIVLDAAVHLMERPEAILVFEQTDVEPARETMIEVVAELATQMSVSDPTLDSLTVIDYDDTKEDWAVEFPAVNVASVIDLTEGNYVLHPHQAVIALQPDFLRRTSLSTPWMGRMNRLYAMTPNVALAKRAPIRKIVRLEHAA